MQVIDYEAIEKNILYFKSILGESKLCAVLKNNAYGHGAVHVARHIAHMVDCFAVGNADEAEQLRFIRKPKLILLPQNKRDTERALQLDCILTVDSFESLRIVDNIATKLNKKARVHIKIDSGMSRLGFVKSELLALGGALSSANVAVDGVFSHFWGDTQLDCDKQFDYFCDCCNVLSSYIDKSFVRHIANTSATLLSADYHLDMVRVGLGLFGYGDSNLKPAKHVYADVIAVKRVTAGSAVGYGACYRPVKDTGVAILNVGYAMGLSRTLVGGKIKIKGVICTIVAICMAMTIVDVGDAKISVGDVATLLDCDVNISNDKVIIYELLCNLT